MLGTTASSFGRIGPNVIAVGEYIYFAYILWIFWRFTATDRRYRFGSLQVRLLFDIAWVAKLNGTGSMASVNKANITAGLRDLGLAAGAGVIVHSSLKSFGRVEGGAKAVIAALMDTVTAEGTLVMPSFNHGGAFAEGAPGYYDARQTPTSNGAIPDAFWRMPGVERSLNPTHAFAAWGKHGKRYTEHHHRTVTMGLESPLGLLRADDGYGLLLGVDYRSNTFHHVVEMSLEMPCLGVRTESYPVRLVDGTIVEGRTWAWRNGRCPFTDEARYHDVIEARGLQREVMIGRSRVILFRLRDCFTVIAEILREGKDGLPPCSGCAIRPRQISRTVASDWDPEHQCLVADSAARHY